MEGPSRGCKGACSKSYSIGDNIGTLCEKGKGPCAASVYTSTDFVCVPRKGGGRRQAAVALETDQTNEKQELSTNLVGNTISNHPRGLQTIHITQMKPSKDH